MKLSTALRKPLRWPLLRDSTSFWSRKSGVCKVCLLGQAIANAGVYIEAEMNRNDPWMMSEYVNRTFGKQRATCPAVWRCPDTINLGTKTVAWIAAHLSDVHGWSKTRIANWVREQEAKP